MSFCRHRADRSRRWGWILSGLVWMVFMLAIRGDARAATPVRVGLHDAPPYVFVDDDGEPAGFAVEVLGQIAAANDWELEWVPADWEDSLRALETGELDLLVPVSRTPERVAALAFSEETLLATWGQVFMRPGDEGQSLLDLSGRRVAIVREDAFGSELKLLLERLEVRYTLVEAEDAAEAFTMVAQGAADAVAVERLDGGARATRAGLSARPMIFHPTAAYFAAPKGQAEPLRAIDTYLVREKARLDSPYHQAFERWFGSGTGGGLPGWVEPLLLILAGGVFVSLAFVFVLRLRVQSRTQELRRRNEQLRREIEEREAAQAQLRQAQKMEAVGELAAGLAHDFNNLLTVIHGYGELLVRETAGQTQEDAVQIREAAKRGNTLTRQLLAFASRQPLQLESTDLNELLEEARPMLEQAVRGTARLRFQLESELPPVEVDRGQVGQVVLNLAMNARDALDDGGTIFIRTERFTPEEGDDRLGRPEYVRLSVEDTGSGMDLATLQRVFEPFFTTKTGRGGTGLGLAVAYGIVRQIGGDIRVQSKKGEGTTFEVYLPVSQARTSRPPESVAEDGESGFSDIASILVVEDDDPVRRSILRVLRDSEFEVLEASTAEDALELLAKRDGPIDLLIADVVLPGIGGPQLHEVLREQGVDVPALYISGYDPDSLREEEGMSEDEELDLLEKPFEPSVLLERVQGATARARAQRARAHLRLVGD